MATAEFQQTLGKVTGFTGTALHTGEKVTLRLHPAPVDHGIKFKRKDLQDEPAIGNQPLIFPAAMVASAAQERLIPATARLNVAHANQRLWIHGRSLSAIFARNKTLEPLVPLALWSL